MHYRAVSEDKTGLYHCFIMHVTTQPQRRWCDMKDTLVIEYPPFCEDVVFYYSHLQ